MKVRGARTLATLGRVVAGFIAACLAAGIAKVLFVFPPTDLAALPANAFSDRLADVVVYALLAATHSAIFAAAFVLIASIIGEWFSVRHFAYYAAVGIAIALLGVMAQFESEVAGQPTILNAYALTAFITAGFVAGLAYWLIAGRKAGSGRVAYAGLRSVARPKQPEVLVAEDATSESGKSPTDKAIADKKAAVVQKRMGSLVARAENAADEVTGQAAEKPKTAAPETELRPADVKGSVPATSKKS